MNQATLSHNAVTTRSLQVSRTIKRVLVYLVVIMLSIIFILPFVWQVTTSVKPPREVMSIPISWIPSRIVLQNYPEAWVYSHMGQYIKNSVTVSSLFVLGNVVVGSFVAFGFARMRFRGRDALFMLVLMSMMIPQHVKSVPLYLIFMRMGWLDTLKPLFVPAFFANYPLGLFLFRQFFKTIPDDLDEAAEIDGSSPIGVWWRIVLPLSAPVIATVGIFTFMQSWNDLWQPLIYLSTRSKYTITVGLRFLLGEFGIQYHYLMATAVMAVLPALTVFFVFQRYFVQGVTMTGLKG